MAKIINAYTLEETNTCYVTYETGTERMYRADRIPKTVQAWLADHQEETEEEVIDEEPETVEEVVETVEEAVDQAVCKQCASSTQADLPAVTQKPELTVPVGVEIVEDNSLGAAEAVAFGTCIAMAVAFWGIVGLIQVLAAGIETLACWTWNRREQAAAGYRTAARWVRSGAKAMAACLPTVTTRRSLLVAVRALPILIGMMALM